MTRPHVSSEIPDLAPHEQAQILAAAVELERRGEQAGVLVLPHRDGSFWLECIGRRCYRLRHRKDLRREDIF